MSTDSNKSASNIHEQSITNEEQQTKIDEVRKAINPVPEKLSEHCSDASIARYLRSWNWNVKKATKMLKDALKWRSEFKPEEIRFDDVVSQAESGTIYRPNIVDKTGRTVLVMRPSCQKSNNVAEQIKYFVYCMENAIFNLPPEQEQVVWLIDFRNFSRSNISIKVSKETAHVLQTYYPERLGVAILYNPPWIFEQLYKLVKPFLETKTKKKVKFVYGDDPSTKKTMEELFDMDQLESAFGGNSSESFDFHKYAQKMKEDDEKMRSFSNKGHEEPSASSCNALTDIGSSSDHNNPLQGDNDTREINPKVVGLSVTAMSLEKSGDVKDCLHNDLIVTEKSEQLIQKMEKLIQKMEKQRNGEIYPEYVMEELI